MSIYINSFCSTDITQSKIQSPVPETRIAVINQKSLFFWSFLHPYDFSEECMQHHTHCADEETATLGCNRVAQVPLPTVGAPAFTLSIKDVHSFPSGLSLFSL